METTVETISAYAVRRAAIINAAVSPGTASSRAAAITTSGTK